MMAERMWPAWWRTALAATARRARRRQLRVVALFTCGAILVALTTVVLVVAQT